MALLMGGYRWLIVAISFFNHACCVGPYFGLNVFYTSWVDDFGGSRGLISWALGLGMATGFAIGPIVASLVSRFGHRLVVLAGTVIMSAGWFASCFATSVPALILLVGLQGGFGLGMQYLPCVALLPVYFNKRRTLAMGIAGAGSGIGIFVYPPLLTWLEELYNWRGSMLIVSAIALNMLVGGALLRPVTPQIEKPEEWEGTKSGQASDSESVDDDSLIESHSSAKGSESTKSSESATVSYMGSEIKEMKVIKQKGNVSERDKSMGTERLFSNFPHKDSVAAGKQLVINNNRARKWNLFPKQASNIVQQEKGAVLPLSFNTKINCDMSDLPQTQESYPPGKLKRWHQTTSLQNKPRDVAPVSADISKYPKKAEHLSYDELDLEEFSSSSKPCHSQTFQARSDTKCQNRLTENVLFSAAHQTEDVRSTDQPPHSASCYSGAPAGLTRFSNLMKNSHFVAFAVSNFLTCVTFFVPPVYMVDRAIENGVEKTQAALALSMLGVGNLFGRIITGWLGDHIIDSLVLNTICLVLGGVFTCLSTLCGASAVLHGIYGFSFGFFTGGFMTLTPLILVDLMGLPLLSDSLGLVHTFRAVGLVSGTPIAGWVYESSSSYTASFIILGAVMVLSGLVLAGLKLAVVRSKRRAGSTCGGRPTAGASAAGEHVYVIGSTNGDGEDANTGDRDMNGVTNPCFKDGDTSTASGSSHVLY